MRTIIIILIAVIALSVLILFGLSIAKKGGESTKSFWEITQVMGKNASAEAGKEITIPKNEEEESCADEGESCDTLNCCPGLQCCNEGLGKFCRATCS
ncbi:MAG: hypothetical protein J7L39_02575 [Candidatus Aenigmarchaeota archaeon]|nr:hypothetical protein [Candidatus Aenigmarchaeota archaeon]